MPLISSVSARYKAFFKLFIALVNVYILDKDYVKAREILHNFIKHNPKEKNNPRLKSYGILKLGL